MNAVTEGRKVLLEIADLKVHFEIKDGKQWFWQPPKTLKAVDGVTLRLYEGETLGVVGESGCGKSTFARAIIGLVKATDGHVAWLGKELLGMKPDEWRAVRSDIQMIFQDPYASLNPRMTVGDIVIEPMVIHGVPRDERTTACAACFPSTQTATRTSSRAGSVSASASPARWPSNRNASSATSRSRRWTCPSRRRSSTRSKTYSTIWG